MKLSSSTTKRIAALPGCPEWSLEPVLKAVGSAELILRRAIPRLAAILERSFDASPIREFLALHSGNAMVLPPPDWGVALTEPQAVKGLAHLVQGRPDRLLALLKGLGITFAHDELRNASIEAETPDRIDLLINLERRSFIVEAKFGHRITKGQLARYGRAVKGRHLCSGDRDILLLIDPTKANNLHHKQVSRWRVRSWAQVLLSLEREMCRTTSNDDDDFRLFRCLLWNRIGGFAMRIK